MSRSGQPAMPEPRYALIVFDWDGTLIDSAATIVACIQAAAHDLGLPVPTVEQASHVIGLGLRDALRLAAPDLRPDQTMAFVDRYRAHFLAREDDMRLFEGIEPLLTAIPSSSTSPESTPTKTAWPSPPGTPWCARAMSGA